MHIFEGIAYYITKENSSGLCDAAYLLCSASPGADVYFSFFYALTLAVPVSAVPLLAYLPHEQAVAGQARSVTSLSHRSGLTLPNRRDIPLMIW